MYPSDDLRPPPSHETTALLRAVRDGETQAANQLFAHLYGELRRLSARYVASEPHDLAVSATGLVHEAYLRLIDHGDWTDRAHFFALASSAMRRILIDHARARKAAKRGGPMQAITLDESLLGEPPTPDAHEWLLAVDAALERLAQRDAALGRMVELRFYGGMEVDEIAEVLEISPRTVARQWARAKAHLLADLADLA